MRETAVCRELIRLALKGSGRVSPNPLVGALVVKDGAILGRGFHPRFGEPHAEVMALNQAGLKARGAVLYVSLEPCNHFGKTPPCTEMIIKSGVNSVWVGMKDPNPLVSGQGIARLKAAGLKITVAEKPELVYLNRFFIKFITKKMPWTLLKNALTMDGRINRKPRYLSGQASLKLAHRWRDSFDAVAVGINTVMNDNPSLNVRLVKAKGRAPLRVIFDSRGRTPETARVFSEPGGEVVIVTTKAASPKKLDELRQRGAAVITVPASPGGIDLTAALSRLAIEKQVTSILVEGGPTLNAAFLNERLADELAFFLVPELWGEGEGQAVIGNQLRTCPRIKNVKSRKLGEDVLISGEIIY